jgi:hypothetical protein
VTAQFAGYIGALQCAPGGPMAEAQAVRFKEMTGKQKIVYVLKVTVCMISFGMIYPNIMHD